MKRELGWKESPDSLPPETLAKIRDFLGCTHCDTVVVGSYTVEGNPGQRKIRWNIHLVNTVNGESMGSVPETLPESDRFEVMSQTGRVVRAKLGVEPTPAEVNRIDAAIPENGEALDYYTQGREKLANFDVKSAAKLFGQAVESAPNYAEAHSALGEAWSDLGYDSKAQDEAKKAFDLSPGLSQETGGLIKARYYEMTHEWDKAGALYSSLWNEFGENFEYGLLLARSQISEGKPNDALATLKELRGHKLPAGIQAQAYLAEADAQENLGNFQGQLKASAAAAKIAQELGAHLLLARAASRNA